MLKWRQQWNRNSTSLVHRKSVPHNTRIHGFIVLWQTMLNTTNVIVSATKFLSYNAAWRLAQTPKCSLRAGIGRTGAASRAPCNRCGNDCKVSHPSYNKHYTCKNCTAVTNTASLTISKTSCTMFIMGSQRYCSIVKLPISNVPASTKLSVQFPFITFCADCNRLLHAN